MQGQTMSITSQMIKNHRKDFLECTQDIVAYKSYMQNVLTRVDGYVSTENTKLRDEVGTNFTTVADGMGRINANMDRLQQSFDLLMAQISPVDGRTMPQVFDMTAGPPTEPSLIDHWALGRERMGLPMRSAQLPAPVNPQA